MINETQLSPSRKSARVMFHNLIEAIAVSQVSDTSLQEHSGSSSWKDVCILQGLPYRPWSTIPQVKNDQNKGRSKYGTKTKKAYERIKKMSRKTSTKRDGQTSL